MDGNSNLKNDKSAPIAAPSPSGGGTIQLAGATSIECPVCHQGYVSLKTPPSLTEALGVHLEMEHGVVVP